MADCMLTGSVLGRGAELEHARVPRGMALGHMSLGDARAAGEFTMKHRPGGMRAGGGSGPTIERTHHKGTHDADHGEQREENAHF